MAMAGRFPGYCDDIISCRRETTDTMTGYLCIWVLVTQHRLLLSGRGDVFDHEKGTHVTHYHRHR